LNLALSALALLILLSPGYVGAQSYLGQIGRFGSADAAATDGVPRAWLRALVVAPFVHAIALLTIHFLPTPQPDLDFVFALLAGTDFSEQPDPYLPFTNHPGSVLAYFTLLNILSAIGGQGLHRFVRKQKWDRKYEILRFPNDWHYLLTGELQPRVPSAVLVDVTLEFDEVTYIYTGALAKWRIGDGGKLERLHLRGVARRTIDSDEFEEIGGDDFIAWCDEIKTLNIHYIHIQTTPEQEKANAHAPSANRASP
jgi:hypothetical protein